MKKKKIDYRMAPTSDEFYNKSNRVIQHMADGGEAQHKLNALDRLRGYADGGSVNEFGIPDRFKVDITPEQSEQQTQSASPNIRSDARRKQNEKMLGQGRSVQEIQADEAANPMAHGGIVDDPRFSLLKDMIKKHKKAHAEIDASKNPMKYIQDNRNMSIKNKKGVAF